MQKRRSREFYFSVEGETEKWYLEHLAKIINASKDASFNVVFKIRKGSPVSFAKKFTYLGGNSKAIVNHLFDYESDSEDDKKRFLSILQEMKDAEKLGKDVEFFPCYSNLTFELWIILHKMNCNTSYAEKKHYLSCINRAFGTKFESLKEYKEEKHFKTILGSIGLDDVKNAVVRASKIMNKTFGRVEERFGFSWFSQNPATEVGTVVGRVLKICGLFNITF